jgi:hypothetical protein
MVDQAKTALPSLSILGIQMALTARDCRYALLSVILRGLHETVL